MRSGMQRLSQIGPFEWFGHRAIEVGDEVQDFGSQILGGGEVAAPQQLPDENTEPKFHLIEPRRVLRCVVEDNLVRWIGQESGTCRRLTTRPSTVSGERKTGIRPRGSPVPRGRWDRAVDAARRER